MGKMPAGSYYVGDLCYVMHDVWDEVCALMFPNNGNGRMVQGKFKLQDGREFAVYSTKYGDGLYEDDYGRKYPVDAGVIGCIRADDIRDDESWRSGGNVVEFEKDFNTSNDDGYIEFGNVGIDTSF